MNCGHTKAMENMMRKEEGQMSFSSQSRTLVWSGVLSLVSYSFKASLLFAYPQDDSWHLWRRMKDSRAHYSMSHMNDVQGLGNVSDACAWLRCQALILKLWGSKRPSVCVGGRRNYRHSNFEEETDWIDLKNLSSQHNQWFISQQGHQGSHGSVIEYLDVSISLKSSVKAGV